MKKFAFKAVSILTSAFIAISAAVMFSVPARAYIDPSVTTAIVQAVAGVAVAVGAVFAIVWRKAKKKAAEVLHIDENANKEVEEDIVEIDENADNDNAENE